MTDELHDALRWSSEEVKRNIYARNRYTGEMIDVTMPIPQGNETQQIRWDGSIFTSQASIEGRRPSDLKLAGYAALAAAVSVVVLALALWWVIH